MRAYEFVVTHKSVLEQMTQLQIKPNDVKYIELYKEYMRLNKEGHKKTYIIQYLSDEYNVDERTIYRVVNRFSQEIEM